MSRRRNQKKKGQSAKAGVVKGSPTADSSGRGRAKHAPRRLYLGGAIVLLLGAGLTLGLGIWPFSGSTRLARHPGAGREASIELDVVPSPRVRQIELGLSAQYEQRDAHKSTWDTEAFNSDAGKQLKALGKLISHPESIDETHVAAIAAPDINTASLRPTNLSLVFDGSNVTVHRAFEDSDTVAAEPPTVRGVDGLVQSLRSLTQAFEGTEDVYVKFKIISVETLGESTVTKVYFLAAGRSETLAVQQNATWTCSWQRADANAPPLLASITVEAFEEIRSKKGASKMLLDCTEAVLGGNASFGEQLLPGMDHWLATLEGAYGLSVYGHHGIAIADVNGDGLDDIYLSQPGGLPNRLFVQNADGTASDTSAEAGVDYLDQTRSALFADLDNDGDQDLILVMLDGLIFLSNDGAGRFQFRSVVRTPSWTSLTAADYDLDGDLDIYGCRYLVPNKVEQLPRPYHDASNGPPNVLLQNDGDWRFRNVTESVGLNVNNSRYSFAASWEDYDNDGDVDLYVANDFGRNNLYRNDGGHFVDVAADAGVEDVSAGMSVSWSDFNNDGLMDIYISNMFSAAGNRVTYQRKFKPDVDDAIKANFQKHARGNSLFENVGDGTFRDVSVEAGVTMGRWAWGSKFIDLNNDGLDDLIVANGYITNEDTKDL